jgi:hypothetical protein
VPVGVLIPFIIAIIGFTAAQVRVFWKGFAPPRLEAGQAEHGVSCKMKTVADLNRTEQISAERQLLLPLLLLQTHLLVVVHGLAAPGFQEWAWALTVSFLNLLGGVIEGLVAESTFNQFYHWLAVVFLNAGGLV